MTLCQLTRLPPNVAGRQRVVDSDICWIFGIFLSYWKFHAYRCIQEIEIVDLYLNTTCRIEVWTCRHCRVVIWANFFWAVAFGQISCFIEQNKFGQKFLGNCPWANFVCATVAQSFFARWPQSPQFFFKNRFCR